MKKYQLPAFLAVLLFISIFNYMNMSKGYEVRNVQVVQLIGIGFLAGILVMQVIAIFKNQKS